MVDYYEGYLLDNGVFSYMLSKREELALEVAVYIVDNRVSIRKCSKEFMISKSSIHRLIHKEVRALSGELYGCVKKQLSKNKNR